MVQRRAAALGLLNGGAAVTCSGTSIPVSIDATNVTAGAAVYPLTSIDWSSFTSLITPNSLALRMNTPTGEASATFDANGVLTSWTDPAHPAGCTPNSAVTPWGAYAGGHRALVTSIATPLPATASGSMTCTYWAAGTAGASTSGTYTVALTNGVITFDNGSGVVSALTTTAYSATNESLLTRLGPGDVVVVEWNQPDASPGASGNLAEAAFDAANTFTGAYSSPTRDPSTGPVIRCGSLS